jgi:hypothetical protein
LSRDVQEWEYKVEYWKPSWMGETFQGMLNKLGQDGWEVIAVKWWGEYWAEGKENGNSVTSVVFKKPKS